MMRVLMLATYFPRPRNPTLGNWALSQAQALQRQGIDVRVVSLNPWLPEGLTGGAGAFYSDCPDYFEWNNLPASYPRVLWYPISPIKHLEFRAPLLPMKLAWSTSARFLTQFVAEFQPDVVYAHHTAVNGYIAMRLLTHFGVPYVITDHDFEEISACRVLPRRRRHFEQIIQSAAQMVAVASRMEKEMLSIFPRARTCTVWNGTDPIPEKIRKSRRPSELEDKTILFSCGAFYKRKGLPLLIDAFSRVAGEYPEAILRIAGDGEQRSLIEATIRRHHLEGRVHLLGYQSHEAVLREMCLCDSFALVGWDEPFATVFSEALSAGRPVIYAQDGGIADVVVHNVHGLAVTPKSVAAAACALARILGSRELRKTFGTAAQQLFDQKLKWDYNATRMKALFERVIYDGQGVRSTGLG